MESVRQNLKTFGRQYNLYIKTKTALKNNLIALLDQAFPGANTLFDSPARPDGHQKSLVAFAGVDPEPNQSGTHNPKSRPASKRGSPALRKSLYLVMSALLRKAPADDPVYQFLAKKRAEGKPYYVYMTAGATKFLRVYYGRVKEYLTSLDDNSET